MLCCFFAEELCSGGMSRVSPYKVENLTLIRPYPTQFPARLSAVEEQHNIFTRRQGYSVFSITNLPSHITFDVMISSTLVVVKTS